ncbi:MAG: hypothetical protein QOI06_2362 [Nocardioidaceae bacterium]|nr:hypothetical protein [Nocardioidaceae bacterium]
MARRVSRYDSITAWYVDFSREWGSERHALLPEDVTVQCVLDMACGPGELSRVLAGRGALVAAVDLSANMLAHAADRASTQRLDIRYRLGDVTTTRWWDGDCFDGCSPPTSTPC